MLAFLKPEEKIVKKMEKIEKMDKIDKNEKNDKKSAIQSKIVQAVNKTLLKHQQEQKLLQASKKEKEKELTERDKYLFELFS